MILRRWRGIVGAEDGDRYRAYLMETGVREDKATPGNRGVFVARRQGKGNSRARPFARSGHPRDLGQETIEAGF